MVYRHTERSERVRADSRARILRTARKLFSRRGYDATTMREVADEAGTSIGNLYFYFRNKEELLETLMAEAREPLWAWADTVAASAPAGPARLAIILYSNLVGLLGSARDLTRAVVVEGAPPELSERIIAAHRARMREALRTNLPEMPEGELDLAAAAWTGASQSLLRRHLHGEVDRDPLRLAEYALRWNLRGLRVPETEIDTAVSTARQLLSHRFGELG